MFVQYFLNLCILIWYTSRDLFNIEYCDVMGQKQFMSHGSIALACNVTLTRTVKYGN